MTSLFPVLLTAMAPLYAFILIGYWCGKVLQVPPGEIAKLAFYILFPLVVFDGIRAMPARAETLLLPLFIWALASLVCIIVRWYGERIWGKRSAYAGVLALSSGTANAGYFGLPVAMALFDPETVATYITIFVGMTIFESSVGFYVTARHKHTARDAIAKLLRLPSLYTYFLGVLVAFSGLTLPEWYEAAVPHFRGAYVMIGMMMIGLGMSKVTSLKVGPRFLISALSIRFILWPVLMSGIVYLDRTYLGLFSTHAHQGFILLSIVPLAANTVAIAELLDANPDKVATAVLASVLIALVYVPLMAGWLL